LLPPLATSQPNDFSNLLWKISLLWVFIAMTIDLSEEEERDEVCAFCRAPVVTTGEEEVVRLNKLVEKDHAHACHMLAGLYAQGILGLPQNDQKANELCLKAGELGNADAQNFLATSYRLGRGGVEIDMKKSNHFVELAAMNGSLEARHNLANAEADKGNITRSVRHLTLAARAGFKQSVDQLKRGVRIGFVTEEQYETALRAYQKTQDNNEECYEGYCY